MVDSSAKFFHESMAEKLVKLSDEYGVRGLTFLMIFKILKMRVLEELRTQHPEVPVNTWMEKINEEIANASLVVLQELEKLALDELEKLDKMDETVKSISQKLQEKLKPHNY